jgi:signal transduction histidine kinase/ActR/RegA family two-component response regulator
MKNLPMPLYRFINKIIFSGVRDTHDSEAKRKIVLFNIFSLITIFFLSVLGIAAFIQKALFLGMADSIMALILLSLVIYLSYSGNQVFCARVAATLANLFFCYLFFTGGVNSTAFMWLYTYPTLSFFLLGPFGGSFATLVLFIFSLGFLAIDLTSSTINVYNVDFAIRFIPSFVVVYFFSFLLEQSRENAQNALVGKQEVLIHLVEKLKKKEKQLQVSQEELERRVAERTAKLLDINEKLQVEIETRKKAELERQRLEQKLSNAQKMEMLGRLAGGVAHDLNNVLSGIVSYPDLLLTDLSTEDQMRAPLETIKKSGEKAAAIVQDLLALARRGVIVKKNISLNNVLNEYFQSPEYTNLRRSNPDISVEQNLAPDLKLLCGSPIHLQKAIMNLVINAFETIDNSGKIILSTENITLSSPVNGYEEIHVGDYVLLRVRDTGIGMTPEILKKIFEPFYTRKIMGKSGTGLGMTVVWATVKDHNGYLNIESKPDEGTVISLYFPVSVTDISEISSDFTNSQKLIQGEGQTVLIVDDIEEQRNLGLSILEKLGYRAWAVSSGEQSIEFIHRQPVDLLLLDMIMPPGIDGLETYKRILKINPEQKTVIISGFSENSRVRTALDLGIKAYLQKPYNIEQMSKMLAHVLSHN